MQIVKGIRDFNKKYDRLMYERDLFGFFLFDDGPSQAAAKNFALEWSQWLDGLAKASKMYFFVPLASDEEEKISNPSLEVAKRFGITPAQLPGIVLFSRKTIWDDFNFNEVMDPALRHTYKNTKQDELDMSQGIYFPLKASLFANDLTHVEEVFRDLFTIIQECQSESQNPKELPAILQKKVHTLKQKQALRPAITYTKGAVMSVLTFSASLVGEVLHTALVAKGTGFLVSG